MSLLMLTLLGCRTTPSDDDLLKLHAQRLTQFAGLQVASPQTIPFENDGDRRVYLEQYGVGFKSGMTGISISPLFADALPHRIMLPRRWTIALDHFRVHEYVCVPKHSCAYPILGIMVGRLISD